MTDIASKVDNLLGKMTIEEKVGQCLMLSFCGTRLNPGIVESAVDMHCGGFHVSSNLRAIAPYKKPGTGEETDPSKAIDYVPEFDIRADINTPYATPVQYAAVLNKIKNIAAENNHGIPLFIGLDQEGDFSADYVRGGVNLFPGSMGLCASGDKTMAYRVAKAVGWQLRACGYNVIHGPVLDVNFNPLSSETSERAYSDQPEVVAEWGAMTLKGFQEAGLIATGKHFPGGGDSDKDCHYDQPVIHKPKKLMLKENLFPYKELIPKKLPMIMTAHTIFSGLDPTREVATVSRPIITELLREELGFEGVVITDSISMKSLMKKYSVPEAGIRAILAGVDLLLFMEESTNKQIMFESLVEAVKSGRIPEKRLDQSVARLLKLKYEYNLFENADCVDLEKVMEPIESAEVKQTCRDSSVGACVLMRDIQNVLPLKKEQKVLLFNGEFYTQNIANDQWNHPGTFWEMMLEQSPNVDVVESGFRDTPEEDFQRVKARIDDVDVIVATSWYIRWEPNKVKAIEKLLELGKPVIVITNNPYSFTVSEEFLTVLCTFSGNSEGLRAASEVLYGKIQAKGKLPAKIKSMYKNGNGAG